MQLKIEKGTFTNHSLEDIASALKKGLSENFKNVEVEVVDCPNLREWNCPSEGISGNQKIIDVGGEPYMHDPNFIGAEFDYQEISKMIGSEKSYALGAGSGAMSCLDGHCGELVINENLITDESRSIIARVSPDKKCIVEKYSARKHGGLGNIYYTDGKQGKVIKIKIKGRSGDQGSLPQAMRSSLSNNLNFIGVSTNAVSDGETAKVAMLGSVDDNQSSLTIGTTYYLETNNNLETSASSSKALVGKAIASDKILVTGTGGASA